MSDEGDMDVVCVKHEVFEVEDEQPQELEEEPRRVLRGGPVSPPSPHPRRNARQEVGDGSANTSSESRMTTSDMHSVTQEEKQADDIQGVKIKLEPFDPNEPLPTGSSTGQNSTELGAIRQLLETLQMPGDDDHVFGEHVACEMRSIKCLSVKKRFKRAVMLALVKALEEDSE